MGIGLTVFLFVIFFGVVGVTKWQELGPNAWLLPHLIKSYIQLWLVIVISWVITGSFIPIFDRLFNVTPSSAL